METENVNLIERTRYRFWLVVFAASLVAVLLSLWIKSSLPRIHSGLPAGSASPQIQAAGWLNGEAPSQNPTPGTIRVMHAWFTTCSACLEEARELVKLHEQYLGQNVEFVGLTYEPPESRNDIEEYLAATGITWVNGYGALETLQKFDVEYFPSIWIINSQGQILWNLDSNIPLAKAIPLALAGKLAANTK